MVAVVLLILASQPAPAGLNPDLALGIEQVRALEEQQALESLARARRAPGLSTSELAQVHLYTGLAHAGLANAPEAVSAFHAARLLDPSLALPEDVSPRVRGWWAQALPDAQEAVDVTRAAPPAADPEALVPATRLPVTQVETRLPSWVPWAVAGAAAVATAGAIWSGSQAATHATEANQPSLSVTPATALRRQAEGEALRANVLYAGAAVLGGGAAVLWVMRF